MEEPNGDTHFAVPKWFVRLVAASVLVAAPAWFVQAIIMWLTLKDVSAKIPVYDAHLSESAVYHKSFADWMVVFEREVERNRAHMLRHEERKHGSDR